MPLRGRGSRNRRLSRSKSPSPNRHKRSWLQPSDRQHVRNRSPSPIYNRGNQRKDFRSSTSYRHSPPRSRSRSPRHQKRPPPKWRPEAGAPARRGAKSNEFRRRPRSVSRERSPSPKPPPRTDVSGRSHQAKSRRMPSPESSPKKKPRPSSPPAPRKPARNQSPGLSFSVSVSKESGGKPSRPTERREDSAPARKVSSSTKKKAARITLHKRFSLDDQPPFELNLKDNVTIAILRNPTAKPSEDVTIDRIFDASVFKMVHKKHEGRRPIFDREEIKVWRHDENLTDDPDFERRLIRVKQAPHKVGDSLTRMSPDVLRKAFGLNISHERSSSQSPRREQQVRLDPRPDPKLEAKYRRQMEKTAEMEKLSKTFKKRGADDEHRRNEDRKEEGHAGGIKQNKDNKYDLRHALERRRSDREESSFRVEVSRGEDGSGEPFYRNQQRFSDDDRNVVFNRKLSKYDDGLASRDDTRGGDARGGRRGRWDGQPRRQAFGRGRGGRTGFRQDWSPERGLSEERNRDASWDRRNSSRSFDRKFSRQSISPPVHREWRGRGGFRGRGRGFTRDFDVDDDERVSPPADGYYKYSQHDDRDVSPRMVRGRPGRGRVVARSFGSKGFHGTRGFRSMRRPRGFRIRGRGRGGFGDRGDRDDGLRNISVEREWKHDMYDSLQKEDDEPHSTSAN